MFEEVKKNKTERKKRKMNQREEMYKRWLEKEIALNPGKKEYLRPIDRDYKNFKNLAKWREYLQLIISASDKAAQRALMIVYFNQAADEVAENRSIHKNKIGFSKIDASYLTKLAHKLLAHNAIPLTEYEALQIRLRMPHYWQQVYDYTKQQAKHQVQEMPSEGHESASETCADATGTEVPLSAYSDLISHYSAFPFGVAS